VVINSFFCEFLHWSLRVSSGLRDFWFLHEEKQTNNPQQEQQQQEQQQQQEEEKAP
jgi:hypothetical protein